MNRNPHKRLGAGSKDAEELKAHPFFAGISWSDIAQRKAKLPKPNSNLSRNDSDIQNEKIFDSPAAAGVNKLEDWTFIGDI